MANTCFNLADTLKSYKPDEVKTDSCVNCHPKSKTSDHNGECDLHSGIHLEVSKEPQHTRQVDNLIIALQRMKTKQVQSTEFSDEELCNILLDNLVEEYVTPQFHERTHQAAELHYARTGLNKKCFICDELQKSLVLSTNELKAITLQGDMSQRVQLDLCAYTPSVPCERGVPVILGLPGNLYLSCTSTSETPVLGLELTNEDLQDISGDMKRFVFLKTSTGQALHSFESAKFKGYFISTSSTSNRERVDVCEGLDAPNRLTAFNVIDV